MDGFVLNALYLMQITHRYVWVDLYNSILVKNKGKSLAK